MVPDQKQVLDKSLFPAFYFSNSSTLHKATMQQLLFGSSSWPLPPDYIPWSQQFIIYTYISTEFLKLVLDTIVLIMEKAMAPHSSTLAWKIPRMEEPGRLQSKGSLRVGHDWVTSLWLFTFMHWRRKWQPTPVFLPGESHGQRSLVGCRLWGRIESDMTEVI